MENPEEILQCLEEFSKIKPKDIPHELDEYLCFVAKTGNPVYQWPVIKCLFRQKLINVIGEFYETCPAVDIPPCLNVDLFNYNTMKTFILEKLDTFVAAPFTVQRICELLTTPRKQYNRIDKYMRALEKNILVVSTTEPVYRSTENGDNNNQAVVNGLESDHLSSASSDDTPNINIEEMDETPPQHPNWNRNTTTITLNTTQTQSPTAQIHITTTIASSPPSEDDALGETEEPVLEAQVGGGDSVNNAVAGDVGELLGGVEEEGGSSEEDEEEERLLLAGEAADKEEEEGQEKNDEPPLQISSSISVKSTPPTPIIATTAIVDKSQPSTDLPIIITTPATIEPLIASTPTEEESLLTDKVEQTLDDPISKEIAASLLVENSGIIVVEGLKMVDESLEELAKDTDSDNMSDKINLNPQVNIEYLPEIIDKLPNTENKEPVITTETISSNSLAEEATILEITDNIDVTVKSDSKILEEQLEVKTPETVETVDNDVDIEKHDTSTIMKEAEILEKEVTQMENLPEDVKRDEKSLENAEKIEEIVANIEELANVENNENNVEQDERMEVDDDTLPDILEATSASL